MLAITDACVGKRPSHGTFSDNWTSCLMGSAQGSAHAHTNTLKHTRTHTPTHVHTHAHPHADTDRHTKNAGGMSDEGLSSHLCCP